MRFGRVVGDSRRTTPHQVANTSGLGRALLYVAVNRSAFEVVGASVGAGTAIAAGDTVA